MSIFCVAILFKLDMKIFSYFGFGQYSLFDEISQEFLLEGEKLVKREIRKRSMAVGPNALKTTTIVKRDANCNLSRTTSREKLLAEPFKDEQNIVDIERNLFDDI